MLITECFRQTTYDPGKFAQSYFCLILLQGNAGIYIMQNTMVRGRGNGQLGKKKLGFRGKIEKGGRKRRKITLKKGKKALKIHLFGL